MAPLASVVESMARLARQAVEDKQAARAKHGPESWEAGEAHGRYLAYKNATARLADLAGIPNPLAAEEG